MIPLAAQPAARLPACSTAPYGGAPGGYGAPAADPYAAAGGGGYGSAPGGYGAPAAGGYGGAAGGGHAPAGPPGGAQWQELHDDQGRPYYYNPATGVTQARRGGGWEVAGHSRRGSGSSFYGWLRSLHSAGCGASCKPPRPWWFRCFG